MFTLIYINGSLNRPDTLLSFLHSNVDKSPLLQIDCVTPYKGTEQDLIKEVSEHLNGIDSQIEVKYDKTQNISTEESKTKFLIHYLVMQVCIQQSK